MQYSRAKHLGQFQVRSRRPIFVPEQEVPQQSESESLAARVVSG
jgi:hypothetical protein